MKPGRMKILVLTATILVVLTALITVPAPPAAAAAHNDTSRIEYTLGETAFTVPGFLDEEREREAKIELTAVVHHPQSLRGPRPVVMLAHGLWYTCAGETMGGPARRERHRRGATPGTTTSRKHSRNRDSSPFP
ncbi:hypothetical protein [Streptomyces shenzhenensis]|uniref:hypothetical protein n=1 Tax=Streptomyces shenzhenensis TaxID=943815 RepID=UPI0033E6431A